MTEMKRFRTIGVVGSGQMGSGIAQLAATHCFDVWLLDTDSNALFRATKSVSTSVQRLVSKGQFSQVIGMHFMNPPPIMKLVEIVRGTDTSDKTFDATKALAERFRKIVISICSRDHAGFVVNRILMPMINEAFYPLYTGVATKEDIDAGMKLGTNHPMVCGFYRIGCLLINSESSSRRPWGQQICFMPHACTVRRCRSHWKKARHWGLRLSADVWICETFIETLNSWRFQYIAVHLKQLRSKFLKWHIGTHTT